MRIYDLDLDRTGRWLSLAAYGRGVWVLDLGRKARSSSAGPSAKAAAAAPGAAPQRVRREAQPARDAAARAVTLHPAGHSSPVGPWALVLLGSLALGLVGVRTVLRSSRS